MTTLQLRLAVAALALSSAGGVFAYVYHLGAERATLTQRLHASDSLVAALRGRATALDTIYRTDTLRLRVAVTRWDTVRQTVATWPDPRPAVPAETVKVVVQAADQAIQSCLIVAQTCAQRVAVRDSIIATLRQQRPLLLGVKDGRVKRIAKDVGKVAAGVGLGYAIGRQR